MLKEKIVMALVVAGVGLAATTLEPPLKKLSQRLTDKLAGEERKLN